MRSSFPRLPRHAGVAAMTFSALCGLTGPANAQSGPAAYPVTPTQRAVAQATAETGVPESELTPNAPDIYTVKRGDTLWAISGLYLRQPWRWPELWGMNLDQIRNPHLIYPGQQLYLERSGGRARLSTNRPGSNAGGQVRIEPRTRYDRIGENPLPALRPAAIEPFLAEPLVIDAPTLGAAPRFVGTQEDRVMLARGDRAYVRGAPGQPVTFDPTPGAQRGYRVFRDAIALKDPSTGEILGYEAQYLGRANMVRGESVETTLRDGKQLQDIIPATFDITVTKEEIRIGDRLLPEPPRQLLSYTPRAPGRDFSGRIVSVYGNAVQFAAQNQVVAINKGLRDGIESGYVLAILKNGQTVIDKTGGAPETLKLPNERIGLLMVFRTFEKVSYALVLEIADAPRVGDLLVSP